MRVLWVTNDLPPRAGGIQQFVQNLLLRVHPDTTVVVGPGDDPDAGQHDPAQPYRVVRAPGRVLPTPAVRRLVAEVARSHRPDVLVLGASWPLGELAGGFRRDLDVPVVALSHGLEAGLAGVGGGALVRRATRDLAALTTISDWAEARLAPHVRAGRTDRIPPGVDVDRFTPSVDGTVLRRRWGVPDGAPLVGCVSRLVRRKGQDRLLEVWPQVRARHPDAWLVLVGEGPLEDELRQRAAALGPDAQVVLTGRVGWDELPGCYAALDLFAMPCRTRLAGTDVEGLGIVYLEAQACAVPAVAGRSGGAPEAVRDGITGTVVDGDDRRALVDALDRWLADPAARATAGRAGRAWVERAWSWDAIAGRFAVLLDEVVAAHRTGATSGRVGDDRSASVPPARPASGRTAGEERDVGSDAQVIAGAEAWSATGTGARGEVGVVICHGFTANPLGTRPLGERFATEGYTVEVPRLPGHGTTHRDLGRTRYEDWYGALERTVEELRSRCRTVVAIGHSMGGTLSLDLASRRHDLVDAVAVINAQVSDPIQPLAKLAPVLKHVVPYIQRDLAGLPTSDIARPDVEESAYAYVSAKAAHSLTSQLRRLRGQLPDLTQPLLVAWSPDDHTVPPDNADELRSLVGSADVTEVVCDRSYHVPQLDYDREKLQAALLEFVARTTGS